MQPGGPKRDGLDNVQFGLHYGIVCQNKDPDKLGRIKVRFPWLDNGDTDQSHWAQVVTPMEGKKFGWYVLPDVDDVVVVMFIAGDSSQPVILGGVWSKTDESPEPNEDGKNNFRGYRSRVGHRLLFDDGDKVKLVVTDKSGENMIGIGMFAESGAGPNKCNVHRPPMAGEKGISITSAGKMEITCKDGKFSLETTDGDIKIDTIETMEMKCGGDVSMDGSSATKLTAGSPCNYDSPQMNVA